MQVNMKEAPVQRAILETLKFWGFRAIRINAGMIQAKSGRMVRLAPAGTSDVLALIPRSGRLFAIEAKRPGAKGNTTLAQESFLDGVIVDGGVAVVIDDVRELDRILKALTEDPWAKLDRWGKRCS